MARIFRKGAVGALLDEYERAISELKFTVSTMDSNTLVLVLDEDTEDKDCISIQSILLHVIKAGYGYANRIRKQFRDIVTIKGGGKIETYSDACRELDNMFFYTEETLNNKHDITLDAILENIMKAPTGQSYDLEQLLEHAVMHIHRHRRQIEMLRLKISSDIGGTGD